MDPKDYEDYQKNNVKASKSQLKEYIQIYADMAKKLKSESAVELEAVKNNIKKTYPNEIYFTLIDELERPVKLTLTESSKEYIIPVFTDIREYAVGSAKISKLFLDKLEMKVVTPEDIAKMAEEDEDFQGFVINPHSQNFNMDRNGSF
ncbi:MAG: SseB family protein [Methanobrevibacter sp.]|uniref:SseB family protein n=1 Tax=Methanobrevibacter sp. TaxID=66852 RepID=UPI0025DCE5D8|nr:SseB family protein [Methanobrevibacter sp.]MBR3113802.1 SseB family protein [Methanobrevibacter sp.]MBR6993471.1 SseB family protein [Methanobrevibacter sp.]